MEVTKQPLAPTLGRKLGDIPHVSGLLRRLAYTSGAGERVADWLRKVAVERGAYHYQREFAPNLPPDSPGATDEEIGIALCLGEHPYNLDHLRAAVQLLSSRRVDAPRLCRLAVQQVAEHRFARRNRDTGRVRRF